MLDLTVVVAMAAASARLGAGIETKLAEATAGAASAWSMPNRKAVPPASEVARGSNGAPAITFRASRREVLIARIMRLAPHNRMMERQKSACSSPRESRDG